MSCALLLSVLLLACAHRPPVVEPLPTPIEAITVDFSPLFGGASSDSLVDGRVLGPDLWGRVQIEAGLLGAEPVGAEPWTRRLLLEWLGRQGGLVIGPPLPPPASTAPPPTAVLRAVSFASGTDTVPVVVGMQTPAAGERVVVVSIRGDDEEPSLCPPEFSLTVGYVALSATLQRAADGALVAVLEEVALLPAGEGEDAATRVTAPLPPPGGAGFCAGVADLFARTPSLGRTDARYVLAAQAVLARTSALLRPR